MLGLERAKGTKKVHSSVKSGHQHVIKNCYTHFDIHPAVPNIEVD